MIVKLRAYKTGKETPFYEGTTFTSTPISQAGNLVLDILHFASGEFTEESEVETLGLERVEITFKKENNGTKTTSRKR